jgi:trans-aconitate 2-methyltransferase
MQTTAVGEPEHGRPRGSDWRGEAYDRISAPHAAMGTPVIERLVLEGDERVLDAGCGSGRLTEQLLERLPDGAVVALDGSASMLEQAARRLARFGDRVTFVEADLADPPLPVDGQVDAILSTATFHWVLDHDALFRGLAGVLRPSGQLSFQCGGTGNAAALIEGARAEGVETSGAFHMAGAEETRTRLAAHGFVDIEAWLEPHTITFETRDEMLEYIVTPYLRPATGLPEHELQRLAGAIIDRIGRMAIDYVRLNVTARRR